MGPWSIGGTGMMITRRLCTANSPGWNRKYVREKPSGSFRLKSKLGMRFSDVTQMRIQYGPGVSGV
jgi:hypothetical protein